MIVPVEEKPWHRESHAQGIPYCGATTTVKANLWWCTRSRGHDGEHIALSGRWWCYAWIDVDPDFHVDEGL